MSAPANGVLCSALHSPTLCPAPSRYVTKSHLFLGLQEDSSSLSHTLTQSLSHTHTHSHTRTLTHTPSHTHIHTHTYTHTHTHSHSLTHTLMCTHTPSHNLSHMHSHTHTHTYLHTISPSHTHTSTHNPVPHLTGLLQLYLVVLCVLSTCSILATLLHSIPHPNHVVFYNFSVIAAAYVLQNTIGG